MERAVHLKKGPVTDPGNWGALVPRGQGIRAPPVRQCQ